MKSNEYDKELGQILRGKRLDLFSGGDVMAYSASSIASTMGWSITRLMAVESADRPITAHEMVLLCRLYGLDVNDVIRKVWGEK